MRRVFCKKDLVYSKNGIQYFWAGESYEVSDISDRGISVYTEINNPRSQFFLSIEKSSGYYYFNEYFIFLDEWREKKLKELGI